VAGGTETTSRLHRDTLQIAAFDRHGQAMGDQHRGILTTGIPLAPGLVASGAFLFFLIGALALGK